MASGIQVLDQHWHKYVKFANVDVQEMSKLSPDTNWNIAYQMLTFLEILSVIYITPIYNKVLNQEKFEDTKGVFKSHTQKKDTMVRKNDKTTNKTPQSSKQQRKTSEN